jgi:MFS family permease
MSVPLSRDLLLINAAAFLRSFTFGLTGVVLRIYLFRIGLSSLSIGLVIAAGLVGSALATVGVTRQADCLGRRRTRLNAPSTAARLIGLSSTDFVQKKLGRRDSNLRPPA